MLCLFPAARNHVNRMCLAADIPLIESGTAGYLGQVTVIKKVAAWSDPWEKCLENTPCFQVEQGGEQRLIRVF